jgi:hypothetical protein
MTETTTDTTETTSVATTPATPKPQTSTITLTAHDGATLQLVAERKGQGGRSYVITTGADKKSQRGMTETHATFEAAKAAADKMAKASEKLGWKRNEARRGFVAKPDAFTTLPAPPPVAKAKK